MSQTNPPNVDLPDKRIDALTESVAALKLELASHKPIEQIVKYLLYFWLTISVLLGVFGWKQLSDLEKQIDSSVARQFPEDQQKYKDYADLLSKTKTLYKQFERLTADYKVRVEDLKLANVAQSDFDLEGQIKHLLKEHSENTDIVDDQRWRAKSITTLRNFNKALQSRAFSSSMVFNAAQLCRALDQYDLVEELSNNAFERDQSAPNTALKLASQISTLGVGPERAELYAQLLRMVENLNFEQNPQIVLAEAQNAAEATRDYGSLIKSLNVLMGKARERNLAVPSYARLVLARAVLRQSKPGARIAAQRSLKNASAAFAEESLYSQWAEDFLSEYPKDAALAEMAPTDGLNLAGFQSLVLDGGAPAIVGEATLD